MSKLITRMSDKNDNPVKDYKKIKFQMIQRYFRLYMGRYDIPEITPIARNYLLKAFWETGTIAAYNMPITNDLAFEGYEPIGNLGQYGVFRKFKLINEFGLSTQIVPDKTFTRDKDIVIGYATTSHEAIIKIVSEQVDRILGVRIAIDNNLDLNKIAFILKTSLTNKSRLEKAIRDVLTGMKAVVINSDDYDAIKTPDNLNTNYIVDKLRAYEKDLEQDLLTFLGINNMGMSEKKERAITDEVKSNNELIARYGHTLEKSLNEFKDEIKKVLGHDISFIDPIKEEMKKKEEEENGKGNPSNL